MPRTAGCQGLEEHGALHFWQPAGTGHRNPGTFADRSQSTSGGATSVQSACGTAPDKLLCLTLKKPNPDMPPSAGGNVPVSELLLASKVVRCCKPPSSAGI